jgi:hypothetical protein
MTIIHRAKGTLFFVEMSIFRANENAEVSIKVKNLIQTVDLNSKMYY